jgi:protein-S-isoprenylcysteine O-methyltransferase Ste14
MKYLSLLLVFLQLILIGAILTSGPILAQSPLLLSIECAGIALGLWAIGVMRPGRFNITPDVKPAAVLNTRGPYYRIRHPMYTSVLLVTLASTLDQLSPLRAILWALLCGVLLIKLLYEERLLAARFPAYAEYRRGTHRLIPYLF